MLRFDAPFFASSSKNVEIEYATGVIALKNGDYRSALMYFSNAAYNGHVSALFNLIGVYGGGNVTPYDFDLAADCWYKAAKAGHPRAVWNIGLLEAADRGGFGPDNFVKIIEETKEGDRLNYNLMICAARCYEVLCRKYDAAKGVIAYELDCASKSDLYYVQSFLNRTGVNKEFYGEGVKRLTIGSEADQIIVFLDKHCSALRRTGLRGCSRSFEQYVQKRQVDELQAGIEFSLGVLPKSSRLLKPSK